MTGHRPRSARSRPTTLAALATIAALSATACAAPPPAGDKVIPVDVTAASVAPPPASSTSPLGVVTADARQWVFRVRSDACDELGTAFAADGEIITNRHVAAGAQTLDLATWDGQDFTGQVAVHSDTEDLALIDSISPTNSYGTLASSDPSVGTPVWVAGYPEGNQLTITAGKILAVLPGAPYEGLAGNVFEISNKVEHGNSGSPLLDSSGQVVGVVYYLLPNGDALAMPVSELEAMLQGSLDSSTLECVDL